MHSCNETISTPKNRGKEKREGNRGGRKRRKWSIKKLLNSKKVTLNRFRTVLIHKIKIKHNMKSEKERENKIKREGERERNKMKK